MQWRVLINENTDQSSDKQETKTATESKENVELTISAAASLKDAMDVIQHTYQEEHPEVTLEIQLWRFWFSATANLSRSTS